MYLYSITSRENVMILHTMAITV